MCPLPTLTEIEIAAGRMWLHAGLHRVPNLSPQPISVLDRIDDSLSIVSLEPMMKSNHKLKGWNLIQYWRQDDSSDDNINDKTVWMQRKQPLQIAAHASALQANPISWHDITENQSSQLTSQRNFILNMFLI